MLVLKLWVFCNCKESRPNMIWCWLGEKTGNKGLSFMVREVKMLGLGGGGVGNSASFL